MCKVALSLLNFAKKDDGRSDPTIVSVCPVPQKIPVRAAPPILFYRLTIVVTTIT